MKTAILIVAGGSGRRMGTDVPKQFLPLAGRPLLMHTLGRFAEALPAARPIVVLPAEHRALWAALCEQYGYTAPHTVVSGGETRFESIKNGLREAAGCELIGVHDGVRPLVGTDLILRVLNAARESGAAIPAVPVTDSLRELILSGSRPVDRGRFAGVQTPQFFRADWLLNAYEQVDSTDFTDDASVVEAAGKHVTLVPGEAANIKVTTPVDLQLAHILLGHDE